MNIFFKSLDGEKTEAAGIANALVHFAFCRDPVFFPSAGSCKVKSELSGHLKENASISVLASDGMINSYLHEKVFENCPHLHYENPCAGAILAHTIASQRYHDLDSENITILAPLKGTDDKNDVLAAMIGFAILYSGSSSQSAYELVFPIISSPESEIALFAIFCFRHCSCWFV